LTCAAESSVYLPCVPLSFRVLVPGRSGPGEVGDLMSEAAAPESVTIPAVPEQVRVARAFVAGVLGRSHPHAGVALLLASELANRVRAAGLGRPFVQLRRGNVT